MAYYNYYQWAPYVTVGERKRRAERQKAKLLKERGRVDPVSCEGRTVAKTFWGKAWCQNLERYSDYANRLPRGRSYLRNGLVVDLQVKSGEVSATVSGSDLYDVRVRLQPVAKQRWRGICKDCAGGIDSLVELLQGRFSQGVMERICREGTGLFPSPREIELKCSCPDWATMCKHVAAVLYGIGARLDERPELLFLLRGVDGGDLISHAGEGVPLSGAPVSSARVLEDGALSEVFGIEMDSGSGAVDASLGPGDGPRRQAGPPEKPVRQAVRAEAGRKPGRGRKAATETLPKKPKRGPGKPRKVALDSEPESPKRKPGRPRKVAPEALPEAPKGRPGRPRKVAPPALPEVPRSGPGRFWKVSPDVIVEALKRGPGRPGKGAGATAPEVPQPKRGRPRKASPAAVPESRKRGPGRPGKETVAAPSAEVSRKGDRPRKRKQTPARRPRSGGGRAARRKKSGS